MSYGRNIYHLFFIACILALTAFKWHDFSLPYFWDELGVYSQAADYQYHHALSLMPASVPPVFSRGHPLLFTFVTACGMRLFGDGICAVHLFCFALSVLLLLSVYLKVSWFFDPMKGLVSSAILAMQPLFLAQCCFVLPEIALSLFVFLALCSYHENKLLLFALFSSLAILTKESAIVLPAAVLLFSLGRWILYKGKPTLPVIITLCIPYTVYAAFLFCQKRQNGWYFFPSHIDAISHDAGSIWSQFKIYFSFLFKWQGRYIVSVFFVAGLLTSRCYKKSRGRSFLLLILFVAVLFVCLHSLFTVYLARYIMVALVIFAILSAVSIVSISENKWFISGVIVLFFLISSGHQEAKEFSYDADLGYRRGVRVVQEAVTYAIGQMKPDDRIYANFPAYYAFTFPEAGYMSGKQLSKGQFDQHGDHYMLLCNPGAEYDYDHSKYELKLLKKFDDGPDHIDLYWARELKPAMPGTLSGK